MTNKKNNELKTMSEPELNKKYLDLIKRKIILESQSKTGSPPKNNREVKNVKKDIARILTIIHNKGYKLHTSMKK